MKTPKATKLPSGSWNCRVKINGKQVSVTRKTKSEAEKAAVQLKVTQEQLDDDANHGNPKTRLAIENYIDSRKDIISPSTLKSYKAYARCYFQEEQEKKIRNVDWQKAINRESAEHSPKTVKNAWMLVRASMLEYGYSVRVSLPKQVAADTPFLDAEQIPIFLNAIEGKRYELEALLALSSLRRSEIYGLTWDDITDKGIYVHSAVVPAEHGLERKSTKTMRSTRLVPYLIPRLKELLITADRSYPVAKAHPNSLYRSINTYCSRAGLPEVGIHGLRRSFASVCYHVGLPERITMAIGGWDDYMTVHRHYIKIAENDKINGAYDIESYFQKCNEIKKCNKSATAV